MAAEWRRGGRTIARCPGGSHECRAGGDVVVIGAAGGSEPPHHARMGDFALGASRRLARPIYVFSRSAEVCGHPFRPLTRDGNGEYPWLLVTDIADHLTKPHQLESCASPHRRLVLM